MAEILAFELTDQTAGGNEPQARSDPAQQQPKPRKTELRYKQKHQK